MSKRHAFQNTPIILILIKAFPIVSSFLNLRANSSVRALLHCHARQLTLYLTPSPTRAIHPKRSDSSTAFPASNGTPGNHTWRFDPSAARLEIHADNSGGTPCLEGVMRNTAATCWEHTDCGIVRFGLLPRGPSTRPACAAVLSRDLLRWLEGACTRSCVDWGVGVALRVLHLRMGEMVVCWVLRYVSYAFDSW